MNTTSQSSNKSRWILLAVLSVFVVTALGSFLVGKKMFPENLSPAMKDFRTYLETRGMEIDGALVRRDRTNARYRATFHLGKREDDHVFFIEEFADENEARLMQAQLGANDMVTPARVTQNGVFVLYIANDWDPKHPRAEELKQAFEAWNALPSPMTKL